MILICPYCKFSLDTYQKQISCTCNYISHHLPTSIIRPIMQGQLIIQADPPLIIKTASGTPLLSFLPYDKTFTIFTKEQIQNKLKLQCLI